jgi:hypothetical protein
MTYESSKALMIAAHMLSFSTVKKGNSPGAVIFDEKWRRIRETQSLLCCVVPFTAANKSGPAASHQ